MRFAATIYDNTKPSARVGRKAHRVSSRQPGRRNIGRYYGPGFFLSCIKTQHSTERETLEKGKPFEKTGRKAADLNPDGIW